MKKMYVGPKQASIRFNNFFNSSITLVGDNTNHNIAYKGKVTFEFWNPDTTEFQIGIYNKELMKISEPYEVMAYNPNIVQHCTFPEHVKLVCKNPQSVLDITDDKIKTRSLMKDVVPMLEYQTVKGKEFRYEELCISSKELVVQLPSGGGGSKTFLCNQTNCNQISSMLKSETYYSVSQYQYNNIPYNIHCLIGDEQFVIFPPSQQILDVAEKIEYYDSEYELDLPPRIGEKLLQYSTKVCEKIQKIGYRGILGIDFIYAQNELYFIEINPRFQGSTPLLDKLLIQNNLPSIYEYNYLAFQGKEVPDTKNMEYSLYKI